MTSSRPTILIVEDSATMTRLYRMVLEEPLDARLLFAGDGIEGLDRAAQEEDVDLYIVDINMPRLDGLEFLRRVRGELGRAVPALVVSTEDEEADREGALAAGATEFVAKPVEPQHLLEVVGRLLGLRG